MENRRKGFTLTELLIVIGLILVLTVLAVGVFNMNAGGDKLRSAARVGQSAFLGARDRALHAKAKRGIRLIRDSADSSLITGFAYVQPIENLIYPDHAIQMERRDDDSNNVPDSPDVVIVKGFPSPALAPNVDWFAMQDFFSSPPKIRIPATTGQWYTFYWSTSGKYALTTTQAFLQLTTPLVDPGTPGLIAHDRATTGYTSCEIEMAPELLPNHQPISLPSGLVIDLEFSSPNVVAYWPLTPPVSNIDILFSPRGMVTGPLAALGPIHFLLNNIDDAAQNLNPIDPLNKGEKLVLTIFPQTGAVSTFPIDPTDADANGVADDLFRFAKVGSAAGN